MNETNINGARDVDTEVEELLSAAAANVVYAHPAGRTELPAVSYYMLSEKGVFSCDNEEHAACVQVQTDVWAAGGKECADTAAEVCAAMAAGGFAREFAMDVPKSDDGVYHRTIRFAKTYTR